MSDYKRPTAREIVEAVVQAMHDAHEPLDQSVVLVPAIYDVMIHPSAYGQLEPILARIHTQAMQRLEGEMERLNRPSGVAGRFLRPLLRLFYPDYRLRRLRPGGLTVERAGDEWVVDILITGDPTAKLDFLAVETDFGGRTSPVMRGDTGLDVRRRTTRLPGGGYETIVVTPRDEFPPRRPAGDRSTGDGAATETPTAHAAVVAAAEAMARGLARLDYEDREGRHTMYMQTPRLVIGRSEDADITLVTHSDVSREHVIIRRGDDGFEIKNVGRYGTRVNGRQLEAAGEWHPLAEQAEIILADAVSIRFEVLP